MDTQINGIKSNGHYKHPLKGVKRSAASIRKQVKSAARNRRAAAKAGLAYGRARGVPGTSGKAPRAAYKRAGRAVSGGSLDARIYLEHARTKALAATVARSPGAGPILGLIELAIEALDGNK